jgi:hypothetical protein
MSYCSSESISAHTIRDKQGEVERRLSGHVIGLLNGEFAFQRSVQLSGNLGDCCLSFFQERGPIIVGSKVEPIDLFHDRPDVWARRFQVQQTRFRVAQVEVEGHGSPEDVHIARSIHNGAESRSKPSKPAKVQSLHIDTAYRSAGPQASRRL